MTSNLRRILSDIQEIKTKPIEEILAEVDEANNRVIAALINDPVDTPYEG
jgi:ubiquitin-protein ligase